MINCYRFLIRVDGVIEPSVILCPRHVKEAINVKRDLHRFDVPIIVLDVYDPGELGECDWCNQEQEESADEGANQ